jgi:hypothetical protein
MRALDEGRGARVEGRAQNKEVKEVGEVEEVEEVEEELRDSGFPIPNSPYTKSPIPITQFPE